MKKKVFVIALCLICGISTFFSLNSKQEIDDLLLANIEALAFGEGVPVDCMGYGSVDCPGKGVKVEYVVTGWSLE